MQDICKFLGIGPIFLAIISNNFLSSDIFPIMFCFTNRKAVVVVVVVAIVVIFFSRIRVLICFSINIPFVFK